MNKRCFIYIRVSTQEQAEEGYSLGEQEERLMKYCEAMGWDVAYVYNDGGYSGGNMNRPALQQMIEAVEDGKADIVLVDKLDRLSRSQFDTLYLIKKVFNANNVSFVSRAEAFDTSTPFGRAMIGILAVFAELERERIKERMCEGRSGRVKEGKFKGGDSVSLGYDYDPEKGYLIPNEFEKLIVNEIYEMIVDRVPFSTIARKLNEKGYKTKKGVEWYDRVIRDIATNKTYIGYQRYRGEWVEALHEPIVPLSLFNEVQAIVAERERTFEHRKAGKRYTSPLGGLIYCSKCGARYHYRKTKGYAKYICYSRSKSDPKLVKDPNCKNKSYHAPELDEAIFTEIKKLKDEPTYIRDIRDSIDPKQKMDILSEKIKSVDSKISKLMDLYSLGTIDFESIKEKVDVLSKEKTSLKEEYKLLESAKPKKDRDEVLKTAKLFDEALKKKDNILIHNIIADLIEYIEIDDEIVTVHWNF